MGLVLRDKFEEKAKGEPIRPDSKLPLDPQNPISSLTSGPQQFTMITDTGHGNDAILRKISKEMPQIAQSGVKHLMLEYPNDEETDPILQRLNSRPPQITADELREKSNFFNSVHDQTGATGRAYSQLLINAMENGISVHFAGDTVGEQQIATMKILEEDKEEYLASHTDLEDISQALDKDPQFIKSLNLPEEKTSMLETQVEEHRTWLGNNTSQWLKESEIFNQLRMDPNAERDRASRLTELANGEKTVVLFGREHLRKGWDLDEALDEKLKLDALKNGTTQTNPTRVLEVWGSREKMTEYISEQNEQNSKDPSARYFIESGELEIPPASQNEFRVDSPQAVPVSKPREQGLSP